MTQTANYPKMRIVLSRKFWEDHTFSRCLPGGTLVRTMDRLVDVELTRWEALEILNDAEYYAFSEDDQILSESAALVRSAKTVVAKLRKAELPDGSDDAPYVEVEERVIDPAIEERIARRRFIRSQHELTHDIDLGRFTYTCGCGMKWTGRDVTAESSVAFDEWAGHRKAIVDAG